MRDQIIELIKKYRAASECRWTPVHGYKTPFAHGQSNAFDRCVDDLEKLLDESKDHLRIFITQKHDFDDREGDISNNAGHLYFKQREKERAEAGEIEKIRKTVVPATHAGRLAEGQE